MTFLGMDIAPDRDKSIKYYYATLINRHGERMGIFDDNLEFNNRPDGWELWHNINRHFTTEVSASI